MKKQLQDVIFASEKRKNILLLLKDEPKEMETLLESLDTTRKALLPQIRVLEEHFLVTGSSDVYKLTTIGKLVVNEMLSFLGTIDVLENGIDYWGVHKLDFIPPHLLRRISELGTCNQIEVLGSDMFHEDENFINEAKRTKYLYNITTFLFPNFESTLSDLLSTCVEVSVIINKIVHERLLLKKKSEFKYLLQKPNLKLYLFPDEFDFTSVSVTDHEVLLRLLTKDENYDNMRFICSGRNANLWGKELFEYYKGRSKLITEI